MSSSTCGSPETRNRVIAGGGRLADDPITQRHLADTTWALDVAISLMRADAAELWARADAHDVATMEEPGRYG